MRKTIDTQLKFGQVLIEDIEFKLSSRDDTPAILIGLQGIFKDKELYSKVMELMDARVLPNASRTTGRPGMSMWNILVLAVLKQGLNCDFDRIEDLADNHAKVRQMLCHGPDDTTTYDRQRLIDNISHLTPELLRELNDLVVEFGHAAVGHPKDKPLRGRCDSFVVESNVHFPTDVSLLWDAMRCLLRTFGQASDSKMTLKPKGWRKWWTLTKKVRKLFQSVSTSRKSKARPDQVKAYLSLCRELVERAEDTLTKPLDVKTREAAEKFLAHAKRQIDQVFRRLTLGETIPHAEKVFSIFEPHTRWCVKGKAGTPVELGVPVCIIEDQHQFIIHHEVMWTGCDVDYAVPMVEAAQKRHPNLRACSFDRGFHSPSNRAELDARLDENALPRKGRLTKADQAREGAPEFREARRQHPAVESAVNHLEHHGLDRVRTHGAEGFERTVALSVLGANVHRLGRVLRDQAREEVKKHRRRRRCAA